MGGTSSSSTDKVTCFKRFEEGSSLAYFKGEMFCEQTPEKTARYIFENWGALNEEIQGEDFKDFGKALIHSDDVYVGRQGVTAKGPVSARESQCIMVFLSLENNTYAIACTSVETSIPPEPDHILADIKTVV